MPVAADPIRGIRCTEPSPNTSSTTTGNATRVKPTSFCSPYHEDLLGADHTEQSGVENDWAAYSTTTSVERSCVVLRMAGTLLRSCWSYVASLLRHTLDIVTTGRTNILTSRADDGATLGKCDHRHRQSVEGDRVAGQLGRSWRIIGCILVHGVLLSAGRAGHGDREGTVAFVDQ